MDFYKVIVESYDSNGNITGSGEMMTTNYEVANGHFDYAKALAKCSSEPKVVSIYIGNTLLESVTINPTAIIKRN